VLLKGFTLVFSGVQLGQGLVDLMLELAFERLLFKLVLVDKVRKLSLGNVSVLPQNNLDLLLLSFVGLLLPNKCFYSL
jgi:hypothetical protein